MTTRDKLRLLDESNERNEVAEMPFKVRCDKCKYYYRTMATAGRGYNPNPYCHLRDDTGETPHPITKDCFVKRTTDKRRTRK